MNSLDELIGFIFIGVLAITFIIGITYFIVFIIKESLDLIFNSGRIYRLNRTWGSINIEQLEVGHANNKKNQQPNLSKSVLKELERQMDYLYLKNKEYKRTSRYGQYKFIGDIEINKAIASKKLSDIFYNI